MDNEPLSLGTTRVSEGSGPRVADVNSSGLFDHNRVQVINQNNLKGSPISTRNTYRRLPPFKVFLLLLCVSLVWHSVLLYKDALVSQQIKLMKEVPAECRPGEMSFLQSVRSFLSQGFSNVDKCAEYHKVIGKCPHRSIVILLSGSASRSNLRN